MSRSPDSQPTLQDLLQAPVDSGALPHSYGVLIKDGDVVFDGGAGGSASDRLYRIASMTKAITSVAVMQLVDRGSLELDGLLTDYLTIQPPTVLDSVDGDGTPHFRPAKRPPTIRELLTHTSGFAYGVWNPTLNAFFTAKGLAAMGPAGAERLTAPMVADPGTEWHYSISTDFLGQVVEAISGVDLDTYFKREIFGPLGMPDSHFTVSAADAARLMPVVQRSSTGEIVPLSLPAPDAAGFCGGGGGLASTPADYTRFLMMLLGGGALGHTRILSQAAFDAMVTNQTGELPITPMVSYHPPSSVTHEFFPGVPKHWGLGFLINAGPVEGRRTTGSLTWAGLFNTHFWVDRSSNIAGLVMTQLLPFCDPAAMTLYESFERAAYASYG